MASYSCFGCCNLPAGVPLHLLDGLDVVQFCPCTCITTLVWLSPSYIVFLVHTCLYLLLTGLFGCRRLCCSGSSRGGDAGPECWPVAPDLSTHTPHADRCISEIYDSIYLGFQSPTKVPIHDICLCLVHGLSCNVAFCSRSCTMMSVSLFFRLCSSDIRWHTTCLGAGLRVICRYASNPY